MTGARDMAGIGVPFAAGVAAGAFFFSRGCSSPVLLPGIMADGIFLSAIHIFTCFKSSHRMLTVRFSIALLFCMAGVFCSDRKSVV